MVTKRIAALCVVLLTLVLARRGSTGHCEKPGPPIDLTDCERCMPLNWKCVNTLDNPLETFCLATSENGWSCYEVWTWCFGNKYWYNGGNCTGESQFFEEDCPNTEFGTEAWDNGDDPVCG